MNIDGDNDYDFFIGSGKNNILYYKNIGDENNPILELNDDFSFSNIGYNVSLDYLNDLYFHARRRGLKSTYYLRNKSASEIEKSTSTPDINNADEPVAEACSVTNSECESCQ